MGKKIVITVCSQVNLKWAMLPSDQILFFFLFHYAMETLHDENIN